MAFKLRDIKEKKHTEQEQFEVAKPKNAWCDSKKKKVQRRLPRVHDWNEQWRRNDEEVKKERSSEEGIKVKKEVKERSLNVWCDVLGFGKCLCLCDLWDIIE